MGEFIPGQDVFTKGAQIGEVLSLGRESEFVFGMGCQLLPKLPIKIWGLCATRVVLDAGESWFEFGFRLSADLLGDATTGWTDADGFFRIDAEWSRDLITWTGGKFVPAPVPVVTLAGGQKQYWSRAIHPRDSAIKTGQIFNASGVNGWSGDARNNPFTSIVIAGAVQALPNYPYTMPTDAAKLQTDLRAAGWPGTVVEASDNTHWSVTIPDVGLTQFSKLNRIYWPVYLIADMYGNLVNPIDGTDFYGEFIDPAGNSVESKGFARLKITNGALYPNYFPTT